MIINSTLYTSLLTLLTASLAIGLIILFKKRFKNNYGIILAIIMSALIFPFLQLSPGKMYVITKELEVEDLRFIGSVEYQVGNKVEVFEVDRLKIYVINNSAKELALEEIIYGSTYGVSENKIYYILPNTSGSFSLPKQEIEFFFNDEIPQEIEEYGRKGRTSKYWLHVAD
jgi:hypothetical protein